MKKTYNVAVLDDHALIPQAIKGLLDDIKKYSFIEGFVKSEMFFDYISQGYLIDILLLDIQLNNEDGIKICQQINFSSPEIIVIMLSSNTQSAIVMDALKKGAQGFLPKNIDQRSLIESFEETIIGKTYIHPEISLVEIKSKSSNFEYIPKLTRREKEVLQLILDEMTTNEIAEKLFLSPSTIETHRASLISKTASKNVVGLIKYTIEKGLLD
ncbi:DNA-binding response regulator [Patiriisocius marinus]|uniref:DNA-binding response regulator n=1 Tax=Patiriisocius marinus TaxID=1397112 RepID=A0A5J4IZW4_9FLAO|nr:response regulator transcription factor [Patiriisocius marinus]GER60604.1 DNA-binding response regulator [Patiriisocius marinus]